MRTSLLSLPMALAMLCAGASVLAEGVAVEGHAAHDGSAPHAAPPVARPSGAPVVVPVSFHFARHEEGHEIQLTDVHVTIDDTSMGRVLATVSDGPYLLANVPEGSYQVTATHEGRPQTAVIVVQRDLPQRFAFYW